MLPRAHQTVIWCLWWNVTIEPIMLLSLSSGDLCGMQHHESGLCCVDYLFMQLSSSFRPKQLLIYMLIVCEKNKNSKCDSNPKVMSLIRHLWVWFVASNLNKTKQAFIRFWFQMLPKCDWCVEICEIWSLFPNPPYATSTHDKNTDEHRWNGSTLTTWLWRWDLFAGRQRDWPLELWRSHKLCTFRYFFFILD